MSQGFNSLKSYTLLVLITLLFFIDPVFLLPTPLHSTPLHSPKQWNDFSLVVNYSFLLNQSINHSIIRSCVQALTHSLKLVAPLSRLQQGIHSLSRSFTRSLVHSFTRSIVQTLTHSLTHSTLHSHKLITNVISIHSFTHSLTHSIDRELTYSFKQLGRTFYYWYNFFYFERTTLIFGLLFGKAFDLRVEQSLDEGHVGVQIF